MLLPIIYVTTALAFLFLAILRQGLSFEAIGSTIFFWLLIYFLVMDLRHWRVPRYAAFFGIILGLLLGFYRTVEIFHAQLLGAIFGFLCLWCVLIISTYLLRLTSQISKTDFAMGPGDPLLLAVIGANMGVLILPSVLCLASVQGVLVFALSKISKRFQFHIPWPNEHAHLVPFGTFLCFAALELAIWPNLIVEITSFIRSSN